MIDIEKIDNKDIKIELAKKILKYVENNQVIGFGSGTTSYLAVIEINKKIKQEKLDIKAIPTSKEIFNLCEELDIKTGNLIEDEIDWAFDGADEVDNNNRLLKGKGKAMFREKLNIVSSPITYILIDKSKRVKNLGEKNPVPVEVFSQAIKYVSGRLEELGAVDIIYRGVTDNDNSIIDAKFDNIDDKLEKMIKDIPGVIESGLFVNYNIKIIE